MSVTAIPPVHSDHALRWKQADDDVFVATLHDEFAGFISVAGSEHTLHGALAQPIGVYRTRGDAQAALGALAGRGRAGGTPRRRRRSLTRA